MRLVPLSQSSHPISLALFEVGSDLEGHAMHCAGRVGLLIGWLALIIGENSRLAAIERPNILMIAVDDLAVALQGYGHPLAQTPNFNRLASRGIQFDRAYCQIPLCNPSRASLMTGLRPDRTRAYDLSRHFRDELPDVVTLPQFFRQRGWSTARVGKIYHYDVPRGIGTDGLDDSPSWQQVINPKGRDVADEPLIINPTPGKPVSAALSWLAAEGTDEEQTDGMIATEAIRLLEQRSHDPFFLAVGFFRPHTPFVAPRPYFELYPLAGLRLPDAPADDRSDIPLIAFAHNNPTPHYGLDETTCLSALQAYLACVSFVDAQVGRLLDALDHLNLTKNTIVVLWSDHGYHLGEHHGIWQKRTLFEESARAPLFIAAPGRAGEGRVCRRIVEFVDIYPTLIELAGLTVPPGLDGRSLRPLLANPDLPWGGAAYTQILRPNNGQPVMGRTIRTERWRYTDWQGGIAGTELYDHQQDPHEFQNLADDPQWETVRSELRRKLDAKIDPASPQTPFDPSRL